MHLVDDQQVGPVTALDIGVRRRQDREGDAGQVVAMDTIADSLGRYVLGDEAPHGLLELVDQVGGVSRDEHAGPGIPLELPRDD